MARATAARYLAVALMAYICIVPFALRSRTMAQEARTQDDVMNASDRTLGMYLRALLQADDRRILLDAIANLDYLNVIVAANAPERFILNVDADPVHVAIYATQREYYLKNNETRIVETYLTDKFAIEGGLDLPALQARNIGYVLVRNRSFIEALDANPQVARKESFGSWVLFALRGS
jgi:hypothetical protein